MITLTKTINKLPKNPLFKTNKGEHRFEMNIKTRTGNPQQTTPQAPYFYHFLGEPEDEAEPHADDSGTGTEVASNTGSWGALWNCPYSPSSNERTPSENEDDWGNWRAADAPDSGTQDMPRISSPPPRARRCLRPNGFRRARRHWSSRVRGLSKSSRFRKSKGEVPPKSRPCGQTSRISASGAARIQSRCQRKPDLAHSRIPTCHLQRHRVTGRTTCLSLRSRLHFAEAHMYGRVGVCMIKQMAGVEGFTQTSPLVPALRVSIQAMIHRLQHNPPVISPDGLAGD